MGLTRVVSGVANILKTTDVQVGGFGLLDQPTMEFMIELDYRDDKVYLVPSDFEIKAVDRFSKDKEEIMGVELRCTREGLPLTVYVDYMRRPDTSYQQKAISIQPCKAAKGAVLRRVTLESFRFKNTVQPLSVNEIGFGSDPKQAFAMVEPKTGKGICFDYPSGKTSVTARTLSMVAEMEVPVENGWKSGRIGISAVSGSPEASFKAYWQFVLATRHPELAKNPKLTALQKRFPDCFVGCRYLPPYADGRVTAAGATADGKGFIFLSNTSSKMTKVSLPLGAATLGLSGNLKLTDWTSLDKPTEIGTKTTADKVELDVNANGCRIIGVNVE